MSRMRLPALLLALALPGAALAEGPRAVIELFTSQGCSSCPPADKLMAEVASEPGVIALSFPVDYWDYLGWKDTLADRAFTARQRAYSEGRGDRHVYTPQAVVDGVAHAVGSDRDALQAAQEKGRRKGALSVPVSADVDGSTIRIAVGPAPEPRHRPASVLLIPVMKKTDVTITRGENKGRTVTYTNVVREVIPLGEWDGTAKSFEAPASLAKMRNADTFVVVVQDGSVERPGLVLGASRGPGL